MDFEKGLINLTKSVFQETEVFGCNFHFGQMIWKKIQGFGLSTIYKGTKSWQRGVIKKCFHLAFIPEEQVLMEFEKISFEVSKQENNENILLFLIYFRKQFVAGDVSTNPAYDVKFWSCYKRVLNSIPRTTNSLEGWHRQLNSSFNSATLILHLLSMY